MKASAAQCPACSSFKTEFAETIWEAERLDSVAPPVLRSAKTNALKHFGFGFLAVLGWIYAGIYLSSLVAARRDAVLWVAVTFGGCAFIHFCWLFIRGPLPTPDQVAAMDDWQAAHSQWQRRRLCLNCGTVF